LPWGTLTETPDLWDPPSLRRYLGLALFFVGFGLIAGTSGLALFVTDNDSDSSRAFAFALVQTQGVATAASKTSAEALVVDTVRAREIRDSEGIAREIAERENLKSCPGTSAYEVENRCGSGASNYVGAPVSSPPALPVAPTDHVENTPGIEVNATPLTDPAPAVVEAPAPETSAPKEQKTARQQSGHRHAYHDSRPRRGRYAQQHFWPFW
jgi:hypothetical protein